MPRLAAALLLLASALGSVGAADREAADAAFGRKDFRKALELYRAELKAAASPHGERRVVSCLAALGEWDEALREGESLVARAGESLDGARARRLVAGVYLDAPHWGFKVGGVLRRGSEHREGEQVWTEQDDREAARRHLESALELLYAMAEGKLEAPAAEWKAERIAADLDLADLLSTAYGFGPMPDVRSTRALGRVPGYFAPRKEWASFLRADDLFADALELAVATRDSRSGARALYARALMRHRARVGLEALKTADRPLTADEQEALRRRGDPASELASVGERFPGDALADEALFASAKVLEERGEPRAAEAVYESLPTRYPKSPWVSDAKASLQDLRRKDIAINIAGPVLPDSAVDLSVSVRNVARLALTAHRLDARAMLLESSRLMNRQQLDQTQAPAAIGLGQADAAWEVATEDDGSHQPRAVTTRIPPLRRGLYRLEARGDGVSCATLLLVTDLALVLKTGADRAIVYVADAVSGAPAGGAEIVVRDYAPWQNAAPVAVHRGATGEDGAFVTEITKGTDGRMVDAVAISGERIAASPETWRGYWGRGLATRVHVTTDRPVYRPGQTVHFRAVAVRTSESGEAPAASARATVIVRDPKGKEVYRRDHTTDRFGVVSGSLALGEEPPLGEYPFEIQVKGEGRVQAAGDRFRVEEYRKPDFEVTVDPGAALRAGETGRAAIVARYYFGSPVADASVAWRVFRVPVVRRPPFRDPHEWLYGAGYWFPVPWPTPSRELVAEGEARTDAGGRAQVTWPTQEGQDGRYEVEAQVVDLSRREVRGAGSVRATRASFDLFLRGDRGFYRPGERASFEIAALDANGKPVETEATLVVFRQAWSSLRETVKEDAVFEQAVRLSKEGRGEVRFTAAEAGEYRAVVTAFDDRREKVTADATLRVASDDTRADLFRLSDVELTLERATYRQGETARVLVASSRPGAVLLTEEAGGEILRHRTVLLGGRGRVVELPLTRAHTPNVFLRATQVADGRVFTVQRELFVPPAERFLSVTVTAAATVKPGEKGGLEIEVKDANGKPVAGSFSLAVSDRSVEAIQAAYAPDIRTYLYGARRGLQVTEVSSFAFRLPPSVVRDAKDVAYRRHGYPPGWWGGLRGSRRDWAGDELQDFREEAAVAAEAPAAQGIEGGVAGGVVGGLPAAAPARLRSADALEGKLAKEEEALVEPRTRSAFADTAYWNAAVETGADGRAVVTVEYPDSLTEWKVLARGLDASARVGEATSAVVARKDLMVRLQSPRFFVERDRALLSALVQNDLPQAVDATVRLSVSEVLRLGAAGERRVRIEPRTQARVEWPVEVLASGEARIKVAALTAVESDAAELRFDALVHGADKLETQAGRLTAGDSRELLFDVPADRARGSARLTLTVAPSLVASLLDAVPYLLDYPYGCVEQTMSRFLPAVVLSKALADSGASLEEIARRRSALRVGDRGKRRDPVFDTRELRAMVQAGLTRIYGFQNERGGFGWWKGDAGDVRMTAYVLYGLVTAREAGHKVDGSAIERAASFLEAAAKDETSLHARAYAAFALATAGRAPQGLDRLLARRADL
ncbi:MAG TPA: MG2 domain-containing protein, partial [Vicinamibacteria bacterium]|nr:MG2 domain-containing protein [Vicinamibacteria bacterium]